MLPVLYKYEFTQSIYNTYTSYKPHVHRSNRGAMAPPNF